MSAIAQSGRSPYAAANATALPLRKSRRFHPALDEFDPLIRLPSPPKFFAGLTAACTNQPAAGSIAQQITRRIYRSHFLNQGVSAGTAAADTAGAAGPAVLEIDDLRTHFFTPA